MEPQKILPLFDHEQRIEIAFPGMRREVWPHVVRFVREKPGMSFVLYSRLDEGNVDAVIQEQIDYFGGLGLDFEWKVYGHDTPADLSARLAAYGFELEEREAVMVLDLAETPAELLAPPAADVRSITRREELVDVIKVLEQVYERNFDWVTERLGEGLDQEGYMSIKVAYVDGQPACAAWVYLQPNNQFASLWGGSTAPGYRRRGLYTAVLAARVQEAIGRGYRYLIIDANSNSRPIVAKHGFQLLTHAQGCLWRVDRPPPAAGR